MKSEQWNLLAACLCAMASAITTTGLLFDESSKTFVGVLAMIAGSIGSAGGLAWIIASTQTPGFKLSIGLVVPYVVALFGVMIWSVIVLYAEIFSILGVVDGTHKDVHDAWTALYLSMITWTTIGYGDVVPSERARFWAATEGFAGYIVMVVFIAVVANMWRDINRKGG